MSKTYTDLSRNLCGFSLVCFSRLFWDVLGMFADGLWHRPRFARAADSFFFTIDALK
jgi:hypothetical protein